MYWGTKSFHWIACEGIACFTEQMAWGWLGVISQVHVRALRSGRPRTGQSSQVKGLAVALLCSL